MERIETAVAFLLCTVLAGCGSFLSVPPSAMNQAPSEVNVTPYPYNADIEGNDLPVEIGRFSVPAVRGADDGAIIELGYVRFPAVEGVTGPPIVFLSQDEVPSAARYTLYAALREIGDVVVFNQRGYGFSSPLPPCPGRISVAFEEPLTQAALASALNDYATDCIRFIEQLDLDLDVYATDTLADDLENLSRALQVETLSLFAEGNLASAAANAMQRNPSLFDKAVFVNPRSGLPIFESDLQEFLTSLDGTLRQVPLSNQIARVRSELAKRPVQLVANSASAREFRIAVAELDYLMIVAQQIDVGPTGWTNLLAATQDALAGDTELLAQLALQMRQQLDQPDILQLATTLNRPLEFSGILSATDLALNWPVSALSGAGSNAASATALPRAPEMPPILILSGTLAPFVADDEQLKTMLRATDSQSVTVVNGTRDLLAATPELDDILIAFLRGDPNLPKTLETRAPPPY